MRTKITTGGCLIRSQTLVFIVWLISMLAFSIFVAPTLDIVHGAGPAEGTYMLQVYAPEEEDFGYLQRSMSMLTTPASDTITVQAHVYVDAIDTSGTTNKFDVFMMWDNVLFLGNYFMYGAQVVYSSGGSINLFVSDYGNWGAPRPVFVQTLNVDNWYNITQVHSGTNIDVIVNDSPILSFSCSQLAYTADFMRIGEYETATRAVYYAYDMYVDFIDVNGTTNFTEDFESDLTAYTITKTTNAEVELVTATQGGAVEAPPGTTFQITPPSQNATYNEALTFTCDVYNNESSELEYGLTITSIQGESWDWVLEGERFWLRAGEREYVTLYVFVGQSGAYSIATVQLYLISNASQYWEDTALVTATGEAEGATEGPVGTIPVITDQYTVYLGLTFCFVLSALGSGFARGRSYLPAVFMFVIGIGLFVYMAWFPDWLLVLAVAGLAILLASMFAGKFGGESNG